MFSGIVVDSHLQRQGEEQICACVLLACAVCMVGVIAPVAVVVIRSFEVTMLTQYQAMIMARGNFQRFAVDEKGRASMYSRGAADELRCRPCRASPPGEKVQAAHL